MPLQVVVFPPVCLVGAYDLLVQVLDVRRQEAVEAEPAPLVLRERGALVVGGTVEKINAARTVGGSRWSGSLERSHRRVPFFSPGSVALGPSASKPRRDQEQRSQA